MRLGKANTLDARQEVAASQDARGLQHWQAEGSEAERCSATKPAICRWRCAQHVSQDQLQCSARPATASPAPPLNESLISMRHLGSQVRMQTWAVGCQRGAAGGSYLSHLKMTAGQP